VEINRENHILKENNQLPEWIDRNRAGIRLFSHFIFRLRKEFCKETIMKISGKCVVSMDYKLTDNGGALLDASPEGQPLMYIHGTNSLIPGLEKELEGKSAGDQLQVTVSPEDAYGPVTPQLIQTLPLSTFQGVEKVEEGMEFEATGENGHIMIVRVEKVQGEEVTINGNHPLAGMTLNFDVKVVDVREATEDELDHGHVHAGDHSH